MRKNLSFATVLILAACLAFSLTGCDSEKRDAKSAFEAASAAVTEQNESLQAAADDLQAVLDEGKEPLNSETIDVANSAISDAQAAKYDIPEMASDTEDIKAQTAELEAVDFSNELKAINAAKSNYADSVKKMELVTQPTDSYVVKALKSCKHVVNVKAATEKNDPNGNLNKAGGYTAAVYFSSDWVDQSSVDGKDVIEKGTDCGGQVEVYATAEDAQKRSDYLATYDGTIFASGSHAVYGTCLIRTSDELTATQQKKLEKLVLDALTRID